MFRKCIIFLNILIFILAGGLCTADSSSFIQEKSVSFASGNFAEIRADPTPDSVNISSGYGEVPYTSIDESFSFNSTPENESDIICTPESNFRPPEEIDLFQDPPKSVDPYGQYGNCNITGAKSLISVLSTGTNQKSPSLWGDLITWDDDSWGNKDIYCYNFSSGEEKRITDNGGDQINPEIWGKLIVWEDYRYGDPDIYAYDLETDTEFPVFSDYGDQMYPSLWGDMVTWSTWESSESQATIVYCDLNDLIPHVVSESGKNPSIYQDLVVWEDDRNGNSDIYLYNISTCEERQITTDLSEQRNPRIYGNTAVYEDYRGDYTQVWAYDLQTGIERQISDDGHSQERPSVFGDWIAWFSRGGDGFSISLEPVSGGCRIDFPVDCVFYPDVGENRVAYTDFLDGTYDVYVVTLYTEDKPFIASFSTNESVGDPPLTVQFSDTSIGDPLGWLWDFGDGYNSTEQNPVHSYFEPGIYTVTLWIYDPAHRDAVRNEGMISVGSEPFTQFSPDRNWGPAPFTVAFQDLSEGQPDIWQWDFGDGTTGTEQNPNHCYPDAGIYNVTLTVQNLFGVNRTSAPTKITVVPSCGDNFVFEIPGILTESLPEGQFVRVNTSEAGSSAILEVGGMVLHITPEPSTGIRSILIQSKNETGFVETGEGWIEGFVNGVLIDSGSIDQFGNTCFPDTGCFYNLSIRSDLLPEGVLLTQAFESSMPEDWALHCDIAHNHDCWLKETAYSVIFSKNCSNLTGPANLTFGVSSDWLQANGWGDNGTFPVETDPAGGNVYVDGVFRGRSPVTVTGLSDGLHEVNITYAGYYPVNYTVVLSGVRDSVGIMRIGDDGQADLLPAEFLYHDPGTNMDYFGVSSPEGLSRFSLVTLGKSGNLFQLIYLKIQEALPGGNSGGGGGGGYGGSGSGVASQEANPVENPTPIQDTGIVPRETKVAVSVDEVPPAAAQISSPAAADIPARSGDAVQAGEAPVVNPLPFTMALLKNLSIVFLVFFITIVLYVRWKRSGGGEGNE